MPNSIPPVKLTLILINWNTGDLTLDCLASIQKGKLQPGHIIVVDNGSEDGSPELIRRRFPAVDLIAGKRNVGFAAACNLAIERAIRNGTEAVWILNNDTVVSPDCLDVLLDELEDERVGAVTGKIRFFDDAKRLWYAGACWKEWVMVARHVGYGEIDIGQYDAPVDVPFISGCCMLIRTSVLLQVGLFEARYFAYCEDMEWCFRAVKAAVRLRYQPRAVLWHKEAASVRRNKTPVEGGRYSEFSIWLLLRNRLFFVRRHARRPWQLLVAASRIVLDGGRTAIIAAALGRWRKVAAVAKGLRDGLAG
jgi:GT2 family glycosyltransferase